MTRGGQDGRETAGTEDREASRSRGAPPRQRAAEVGGDRPPGAREAKRVRLEGKTPEATVSIPARWLAVAGNGVCLPLGIATHGGSGGGCDAAWFAGCCLGGVDADRCRCFGERRASHGHADGVFVRSGREDEVVRVCP